MFVNLRPMAPPGAPKQGMKFWHQTGTHWAMGDNLSIGPVNSRSFYVRSRGQTTRYLLVEWNHWLSGLFATGHLFLDGTPLLAPTPMAGGTDMGKTEVQIDIRARDQRVLRAVADVLKRYKIKPEPDEGNDRVFSIVGGDKPYAVKVASDWSAPPRCSCPDAANQVRQKTGVYCKHVNATLMSDESLRYQLLDVFL